MAWFKCYFPDLDGPEAENLLREHGIEGSFLIRPSSVKSNYTLTAKCASGIVHTRINYNGDIYEFASNAGEAFASLTDLVEHYMENKDLLQTNEGVRLQLKFPYRYNDPINNPTQEDWYHGNITGQSAEDLLRNDSLRDGAFLVRDSRSEPGSFAFSVKSSNKIKHLKIYKTKEGRFQLDDASTSKGRDFKTLDNLVEHYKQFGLVDDQKNIINFSVPVASNRVHASVFHERCKDRENKTKDHLGRRTAYAEEFRGLQESEARLKNKIGIVEGKKNENREKNRYTNIVPYDNFRFQLADSKNGYINASYINHYDTHFDLVEKKRYISTQGPLPHTIEDFWQMIAQEKTPIIMMIALEQERGRKKCEVYWPSELNVPKHWGKATVTMVREEKKTDIYTERHMTIKYGNKPAHNVVQFQFLKWPDFDVPPDREIGEVLEFLRIISGNYRRVDPHERGAIVVHCSAGIGRSGAIIVIDMICDQIRKYGDNFMMEIKRTVMHCRDHRPGMVQTEAQYAFIYKAIREHLETTSSRAVLDTMS